MRKYIMAVVAALFLSEGIMAQPKAEFDKTQYVYGTITWMNPALVTFNVSNKGDQPLFIKDVRSSCGCTVVTWTKEPIRPGEVGTVSATFDAETLGHFDKELAVYTNADSVPTYLKMSGDVVRVKPEYTGDYPCHIGDVSLSTDEVEFDDVNRGDSPQYTIELMNTGKKVYRPELMHLPKYLKAEAVPAALRSGKSGKLILTLDSKKLDAEGLTKTRIYLSRFTGDKVSNENELSVSAVLLPGFDKLSATELANSPILSMSADSLQLPIPQANKKSKGYIVLKNNGRTPLAIRSLQVFNSALNVSLDKRQLESGESTKLEIAVVARYLKVEKGRLRVLMITNDPRHAKVYINVLLTEAPAK